MCTKLLGNTLFGVTSEFRYTILSCLRTQNRDEYKFEIESLQHSIASLFEEYPLLQIDKEDDFCNYPNLACLFSTVHLMISFHKHIQRKGLPLTSKQ